MRQIALIKDQAAVIKNRGVMRSKSLPFSFWSFILSLLFYQGLWRFESFGSEAREIVQFADDEDFDYSSGIARIARDLSTSCHDGWYTLDDMCYKIFDLYSERKTWSGASTHCKEMSSTLVSIHSAKEQDFITSHMSNIHSKMWIGLHRKPSEYAFVWEDQSPLDFTNWNEGEPINRTPEEEVCVQMIYSSKGKWDNEACRSRNVFICQKPKVSGVDFGSGDNGDQETSEPAEKANNTGDLETSAPMEKASDAGGVETHISKGSIALVAVGAFTLIIVSAISCYFLVPFRKRLRYDSLNSS